MEYRKLGATELRVSPLCIGAWQLAGPLAFDGRPDGHPDPGKENVLRLIRILGEKGINFIDTAEQYGNGESERRVGEAIQGRRDQWILSTKFGYRVAPNGSREDDSSPPTILPSLEGSLRRLRTDVIDIYLYHCAPKIEDLQESRVILEQAKKEGKIRYYGISTNNFDLIRALEEHSMLDVLQYHTNILEPNPEIYDFVCRHDTGVQVRGVMAQGRLSGKYFHHKVQWGGDDNRSNRFKDIDYRKYAIFEDALPEGMTMAQAAIRWALDQPGHHSICMGAKNLADYEAAIAAAEMPRLGRDITDRLEKCAAGLRKS